MRRARARRPRPAPRQPLPLALAALVAWSACGEEAPTETDPRLSDPRIEELLQDCARGGYYDRFVDDMVPVLVEKLTTVGGDPLKRAKEELGEMGERSADELRRLFDEHYASREHGAYVENALDAAALNGSRTAHDILLRALDHPRESVRHRAMLGMVARHASPEDFELFRGRVEGNEPLELRRLYLRAMFVADAERGEAAAIEWLRAGAHQPLWIDAVQALGASTRPETAWACAGLFEGLETKLAVWLAASAARFEDEAATRFLREERDAEQASRRVDAVRALAAAGRTGDLLPAMEDPHENVRIFAIEGVANAPERTTAQLDALAAALSDGSQRVRDVALGHLCRLGDVAALDLALSHLVGGPALLQGAIQALRGPIAADEALARRAFERLMERHELEKLRPLRERAATFKAVGIVPLADAARFLRETALAKPDERIEGLRSHDWLMIQASNTGAPGRDYLWSELAGEADPLRRLDLIGAVASTRNEDERDRLRERMLSIAEDTEADPYERLFAAGRAVRVGPSSAVAPRLRLVPGSLQVPEVQVAMQCLLWSWY